VSLLKSDPELRSINFARSIATTRSKPLSAALARLPRPSAQAALGVGGKVFRWLGWGAVFAVTTSVSMIVGATLALVLPLSSTIAPKAEQPPLSLADAPETFVELWQSGFQYRVSRPVNILIMGIDEVPNVPAGSLDSFSGRSDTMLLLRVDPTNEQISILSIPRDTQVPFPEQIQIPRDRLLPEMQIDGVMKINQANALGGPALAGKTVSKALNGITIDRYVRINTEAFRELVDLLGGVEVYVPQPMKYSDFTQKLHINLKQGLQTLNGEQAEQFARFRYDAYGDIGRVQRQQVLLKALKSKLLSPSVVPKLPQILRLVSTYVDTNLSIEEMLALINFGMSLESGDVNLVMLPGHFSRTDEYVASYWILDQTDRDRVLSQYFALGQSVASTPVEMLNIAIQNASGKPDAAGRMADYLRSKGFRNVYVIEDWPSSQPQTQIIVQKGDQQAAKMLQQSLGFGKVEAASIGDIESDLTLRVGTDQAQ